MSFTLSLHIDLMTALYVIYCDGRVRHRLTVIRFVHRGSLVNGRSWRKPRWSGENGNAGSDAYCPVMIVRIKISEVTLKETRNAAQIFFSCWASVCINIEL